MRSIPFIGRQTFFQSIPNCPVHSPLYSLRIQSSHRLGIRLGDIRDTRKTRLRSTIRRRKDKTQRVLSFTRKTHIKARLCPFNGEKQALG
jgi:hypothetical protein